MSDERCRVCGDDFEYDELTYGVCAECYEEFINDEELMLAYVDKHEYEFYADYCFNVNRDCYVETIKILRAKIEGDIKLKMPYALTYLRDFCHNDMSDYIDFCVKKTK